MTNQNSLPPGQLDFNIWHQTAHRLKHSAGIVFPQLVQMTKEMDDNLYDLEFHQKFSALVESYMMLLGFAFENLIKAIAIFKFEGQASEITNFKKLKKDIWGVNVGHEITDIADNCKFEIDKQERELIERCTVFLVWAGRYAFGRTREDQAEAERKMSKSIKSVDEFVVERIFQKAQDVLGAVKY